MFYLFAFAFVAAATSFSCALSAGGRPWDEPTLESMPNRARVVRWPLPAKLDLN